MKRLSALLSLSARPFGRMSGCGRRHTGHFAYHCFVSPITALEPDLVIMHLGVNDALLRYNTWLVNAPRPADACETCPSYSPSVEIFNGFCDRDPQMRI